MNFFSGGLDSPRAIPPRVPVGHGQGHDGEGIPQPLARRYSSPLVGEVRRGGIQNASRLDEGFSRLAANCALAATLFLIPAIFTASPARAFEHRAVAKLALERHIVPGYERFAAAATTFEAETAALCEAPSPERLERARAAFREAALAWGRIEHIRFGPAAIDQRRDRLLFWPDRKGLGRRQVENLVATGKPEDFEAEAFEKKSVAVQGFTAFDIVAFGAGSETLAAPSQDQAVRCLYARAIAANVAAIARALLAEWTDAGGYRSLWLAPGAANGVYLDDKETTRALARAYLDGLEQTRDVRLAGPLGFKDRTLRPLAPPFPNSHLAALLIAANIEGERALLSESGFLDKTLVAPAGRDGAKTSSVLGTIAGELDRAAASAKAAAELSPAPFEDARAKEKLVQIGFPLKNARFTGGAYLSEAAGLGIGLNASDGD